MEQINWDEMHELAAHICGISADSDQDVIEGALYNKYNITYEDFEALLKDLLETMSFSVSPLTSTPMIGFSNKNLWFIKKNIPVGSFIQNLIEWITNGDDPDKGFVKPITVKGIVTYNLYLIKSEYEVSIKKGKL